ncbi:MAG: tetratricopeptide repeat protein [Candidatus Omnitrophota bacterium]
MANSFQGPAPKFLKALILLAFISIIIYSNSLGGEFIWDDELFVVRNISIRKLENIPSFFTDPSTVALGALAKDVYRPFTTVSYSLDYFLWRLNAFGYHLSNVLLHSCNGILVCVLLWLISGNFLVAFFSALLFLAHPVQTEVVSWVSGRSSVLFTFFYLASLISYVRYSASSKKRFLALSIASCAIALFSKEMAVTLPLAIILYDVHFAGKKGWKPRALVYAPYFALAAFYVITRSAMLGRVSQMGWWGESPYYTFLTMLKVVVDYVRVLFLPTKLYAVFYLMPLSTSVVEKDVLVAIALLVLACAALLAAYRRERLISFAMGWFFISLLPVLNIVPLKALEAERFLYLPSIGFCIFLAAMMEKFTRGSDGRAGRRRLIAIVAAVLIASAYSVRTMERNEDWKNAVAICEKNIEVTPLNSWVFNSLGTYLTEKGDYEKALRYLKKAEVISGGFYITYNNLGHCYLKMGKVDRAIEEFRVSISLKPDFVESRNALGVAYASAGRYDEAAAEFEEARKINPEFLNTYLNIGRIWEKRGEYDKARAQYYRIIAKAKEKREAAVAYMRIGDTYAETKDAISALDHYKRSLAVCDRSSEDIRQVVEGKMRELK